MVELAPALRLLSDERFTVDGTPIGGWAWHKGFRPEDGAGGDGEGFRGQRRRTLGADKGRDPPDFVEGLRALGVTPQVARNMSGRRSRIDGRTTRHSGREQSQRRRKLAEPVLGRMKTTGAPERRQPTAAASPRPLPALLASQSGRRGLFQ